MTKAKPMKSLSCLRWVPTIFGDLGIWPWRYGRSEWARLLAFTGHAMPTMYRASVPCRKRVATILSMIFFAWAYRSRQLMMSQGSMMPGRQYQFLIIAFVMRRVNMTRGHINTTVWDSICAKKRLCLLRADKLSPTEIMPRSEEFISSGLAKLWSCG